jgi:hypothetical protein
VAANLLNHPDKWVSDLFIMSMEMQNHQAVGEMKSSNASTPNLQMEWHIASKSATHTLPKSSQNLRPTTWR